MASQEFIDVRSRVADLRRLLAASMADEQRMFQRHGEEERESDRWRRRAELAAGKGDDGLARAALERSGRHAALAADFRLQYLRQREHVEEMKGRLMTLEARVRATPSTIASLPDSGRVERTLSRLRRQEERAAEERATLAAFAELERDEVAEKIAALEREDTLERQLAELKQRLGVTRGADAGQTFSQP